MKTIKFINIKSVIKYTALAFAILALSFIHNVSFAGDHEYDEKVKDEMHTQEHDRMMDEAKDEAGDVKSEVEDAMDDVESAVEEEKGRYTHDESEASQFVE